MFNTIPYFNHKLCHQVVPDKTSIMPTATISSRSFLELVLIPMEIVPTVAGQQGVAPCGNEV